MVTIQVKRPARLRVDRRILFHAAERTLELSGAGSTPELTIVIGDDRLVQKLNRQYLGEDKTTDVLSFPAGDINPDTSGLYLGDVVISLPTAQQQASAGHHSLADELQLLVVHGVLHLLGYDHLDGPEKKKMQALQDQILADLGSTIQVRL